MVNLNINIIRAMATLACMSMNWGPRVGRSAMKFIIPDRDGDIVESLENELKRAQIELVNEITKLGENAIAATIDIFLNGGMIVYIQSIFGVNEAISNALKALLKQDLPH